MDTVRGGDILSVQLAAEGDSTADHDRVEYVIIAREGEVTVGLKRTLEAAKLRRVSRV